MKTIPASSPLVVVSTVNFRPPQSTATSKGRSRTTGLGGEWKNSAESDEEDDNLELDLEQKNLARIEHLLFDVQKDLIARRNSQAISKLNQAVALGSSAACATLGNLFSKGIRDANPSSPRPSPSRVDSFDSPSTSPLRDFFNSLRSISTTVPDPSQTQAQTQTEEVESAGLAAAKLFIKGLEIELSKPILDKTRTRSLVRHRSEFESETDDDEGQTVEGREIGLQRVFDLVIGLTDSYRFGILLPSNDSAFSLSPPVDPSSRHPSASSISTTIFTPSDTLFDLGASIALEILSHPVLDPSQATPPPHNIHQNHPLFNLSSPRQIPTIKAHLLYLLALHSWSSDREGSVKCWEEILGIANAAAGGLGKEGDEIILKSASRLGRGTQGEECKLVKKKVLRGGGNRKMVGSEGVGGRRRTAPSSDAYNTTTRDEVPTSAISIGQECPPSPPTSEEHHSSTSSKKPRALTFHFRPDDGYPSPPASPLLELGDGSTESFSALISSEIDEEPLQPPSKTLRRLASNSSFQPTPPNLDRMFKRAESITYISTLPPDFFSSKSKLSSTFVRFPSEAAAQAVFPSGSSVETPSRDVEAGNPKSSREAVSWTANFRKKLSNFRSTEVISTLFRRKDKEGTSAAVETLQKVLLRDDLSAGPGMYWGDFNELEADVEIESEVGTELETEIEPEEEEEETLPAQNQYGPKFVAIVSFPYSLKRPPPALRSTRSFFDPTTSSPSVAIPRVPKRQVSLVSFDTPPKLITTPPTPDKSPFPSSSKQSSLERSPSKVRGSGNGDLDPYLAELERKSRVGVKTKCSTCGKQGLNFPACPRCMENYCSRSCRTEKGLAGDGERHVCAGKCR